jgi:hypothetical protein
MLQPQHCVPDHAGNETAPPCVSQGDRAADRIVQHEGQAVGEPQQQARAGFRADQTVGLWLCRASLVCTYHSYARTVNLASCGYTSGIETQCLEDQMKVLLHCGWVISELLPDIEATEVAAALAAQPCKDRVGDLRVLGQRLKLVENYTIP